MTKKYRTKQILIDEQTVEIEGLKKTIEDQYKEIDNLHKQFEEKEKRHKDILSWRDIQLKRECEKLHEIRNQEFQEDSYKNRIKYEARKFADIVSPEASITVYEDHYRPDEPTTVLANIQVFEELFDDEVGGEMKTDLLKEMDKLSEALSAFYSALSCDIRINMSINRY